MQVCRQDAAIYTDAHLLAQRLVYPPLLDLPLDTAYRKGWARRTGAERSAQLLLAAPATNAVWAGIKQHERERQLAQAGPAIGQSGKPTEAARPRQ